MRRNPIIALFLDVDGVLNHADIFKTTPRLDQLYLLDPACVRRVKTIVKETGCVIVLSSTWRHDGEAVKVLKKELGPIYGKTPRNKYVGYEGRQRGTEVRSYLKEHPEIVHYAILDDDSDFFKYQPLFLTKFHDGGLTSSIMQNVIRHLRKALA